MSKYDPFQAFLNTLPVSRIRMSFAQIENVLGFKLPASQRYNAWWSNNPSNNVFTPVWLRAGFRTCDVDPVMARVTFERAV